MEPFSPKAYLKRRRPQDFSDSAPSIVTELDRSLLEYHLSSLTSRSQEAAFELFARHLCEREICPNLLPTTGPTGGGDSKADAETYPVSHRLSLAWLTGVEEGAAFERWAFAFSAKAKWAPKLESDVEKIVSTNRGYTKAFFVTNQAVKASRRAELEDRLSRAHSIDVRVLDRTWILDRVFANRHQDIALETLSITTSFSKTSPATGRQDQDHRAHLTSLEERLTTALRAKHVTSAVVDDALEAARLMRALELPAFQVEGGYLRTERLAKQFGTARQRVEVAYQWASTRYYWLEDFEGFIEQYRSVEKRVAGSRNAFDLERMHTLWVCLWTAVQRGVLDASAVALKHRYDVLVAELERLEQDLERPSTALQARTMLVETRLMRRFGEGEPIEEQLRELANVLLESRGLVGFPVQPLLRWLTEVGGSFEGMEGYDDLFEQLVELAAERDSELTAARLLLRRGEQQWKRDRPVEAIATLGRSLTKLYKEESRHELAWALYVCGCALAEVNLPWAARGMLLASASMSADHYWTYGKITPSLYAATKRLKWIELSLGRMPQLLAWHENTMYMGGNLIARGENAEELFAGDVAFEQMLAGLLLRTPSSALPMLEQLPAVLDNLRLELAADALLFALGHEERLTDLAVSLDQTAQTMASTWLHTYADGEVASQPTNLAAASHVYRSKVLGCELVFEIEASPACIAVAEALLAMIEGLLATAGLHQIFAHERRFLVQVRSREEVAFPFVTNLLDTPKSPCLAVDCSTFDPHRMSIEAQYQMREALNEACISVMAALVVADEAKITALFGNDLALDRAANFGRTFGFQANVLGDEPKLTLDRWTNVETPRFPAQRETPWQPDPMPAEVEGPAEPLETEDLSGRFDPAQLKHGDMMVTDLVRLSAWDRARWEATGYMYVEDNRVVPWLGLVFKNREAAREIFAGWRELLGEVDEHERLRIAIVRGVDRSAPLAYRVVVGPNLEMLGPRGVGQHQIIMISRINEMNPQTSTHLEGFLNCLSEHQGVWIMPAFMVRQTDGSSVPEFDVNHRVLIRRVVVRQAWQIGLNDPDICVLHMDDQPIIPTEAASPPVREALRFLRTRRS